MHCHTASVQWAVELLQCAGPPAGGRGILPKGRSLPTERNCCNVLPNCPGAVGSGTHVMTYLAAWGQWAMELLQHTASLRGRQWAMALQRTASLPGGSGQSNSSNALPQCLGAVGSATPAMQCLTAWAQWTVEFLQRTATRPRGSGEWNAYNALPHCHGAVGGASLAMQCHAA